MKHMRIFTLLFACIVVFASFSLSENVYAQTTGNNTQSGPATTNTSSSEYKNNAGGIPGCRFSEKKEGKEFCKTWSLEYYNKNSGQFTCKNEIRTGGRDGQGGNEILTIRVCSKSDGSVAEENLTPDIGLGADATTAERTDDNYYGICAGVDLSWYDVAGKITCAFTDATFFFSTLVLKTAGGLLDISLQHFVFDISSYFRTSEGSTTANATIGVGTLGPIWIMIRDLANMGFIFILLYIGARQIFADSSAKSLSKDILSILAVGITLNFSLLLCQTVIDFSNWLAFEAHKSTWITLDDGTEEGKVLDSLDAVLIQIFKIPTLIPSTDTGDLTYNGTQVAKSLNDKTNNTFQGRIVFGVFSIIFLLMVSGVFFSATFLFFSRFVHLLLLTVFSPLAFAALLLPKTSGYFKEWLNGLLGQAFAAPVFLTLMAIAIQMIYSVNTLSGNKGADGFLDISGWIEAVLNISVGFMISFAFIYFALSSAKKITNLAVAGINIGKFSQKLDGFASRTNSWVGNRMLDGVSWAGTRAGGGAMKKLRDSDFVQRNQHRFFGDKLYKALDKGAKATYDVRNTDLGKGLGKGVEGGLEAQQKAKQENVNKDWTEKRDRRKVYEEKKAKEQGLGKKRRKEIERDKEKLELERESHEFTKTQNQANLMAIANKTLVPTDAASFSKNIQIINESSTKKADLEKEIRELQDKNNKTRSVLSSEISEHYTLSRSIAELERSISTATPAQKDILRKDKKDLEDKLRALENKRPDVKDFLANRNKITILNRQKNQEGLKVTSANAALGALMSGKTELVSSFNDYYSSIEALNTFNNTNKSTLEGYEKELKSDKELREKAASVAVRDYTSGTAVNEGSWNLGSAATGYARKKLGIEYMSDIREKAKKEIRKEYDKK